MGYEGGSDEHLEEDTSASNNKRVTFAPLIVVLNSQSQTNLRVTEDISAESPESPNSVSPSSSNSSSDDFIPITPKILLNSREKNGTPQPNGGRKLSHANDKCNVTSEDFYGLEETTNESPQSSSQSSDVTYESVTEHVLPTLSPSIQVMEWPQGLDSNGVSTSHSHTQNKGSAASNDSLFSMEVDLFKSDERPTLDRPKDIGNGVKHGDKGTVDEPINSVSKAHQDEAIAGDSRDSSTAKSQSDKIATSNPPIALPIKKKSSSSMRHCPGWCPTFHCSKGPIPCSKWPSCSFKWFIQPSCSRNCLSWLACCCKSPICHCKFPVWSTCCVKRKS